MKFTRATHQIVLAIAGTIMVQPAMGTILTHSTTNLAEYGRRVTSETDAFGTYLEGEGWTPNVTTFYRSPWTTTRKFSTRVPNVYRNNYGDLQDVVYPDYGQMLEVRLVADSGYAVNLHGFQAAGWRGISQPITLLKVMGENGEVLFDSGASDQTPIFTDASTGHLDFAPSGVSSSTLRIVFAGQGINTALDNISISQTETSIARNITGSVTIQDHVNPGAVNLWWKLIDDESSETAASGSFFPDASGAVSANTNSATGVTYRLRMGARPWLRRQVKMMLTGSGMSFGSLSFVNGDASGDNKIDGTDFDMVLGAQLAVPGDPRYNSYVDLDGSGIVDTTDLLIVIRNYGLVGE